MIIDIRELNLSKYIGIEFADVGRGEKCDCWGLVMKMYWELFAIKLPSWDEYSSSCDVKEASGILKRKLSENNSKPEPDWNEINLGDERFGDIVMMRVRGAPVHIGMVAGNEKMIHIEKGIDSCLESYRGKRWKSRVVAFYRHKKNL